jgi:quinol monooxygenase YgiN
MKHLLYLLLSAVMLSSSLWAQIRADAPPDTIVHAVSYVEVMPSFEEAAMAALRQYRDTSRKDEGYLRFEFFEQIGRPGHLAIVETWTDQKAFDAHGMAAHTRQSLSTLQPMCSSDYDQRPYKTLAVGSAPAAPNRQAIYVVTHVDTLGPQTDAPGLLKRLAEASRKDAGNLRFDVLQHATRANHFTIVETWQNQKALDAHAAAEHTRQYRDALHSISGGPLDERVYKGVAQPAQ